MKTIVAIDLGKRKSVFCRMNASSLKPEFFTLKTRPEKFHDIFSELDRQNSVVLFEIGAQAGWLADMLRAMQLEFQAANVNHPAWQWKNNPNKSDKEDALRLAMMYRLGQLPTVYIPLKDVRQKRSFVYYRQRLVDRRTQIKNNIRAITTGVAIQLPDGRECWTIKHRQQLRQLARPLAEVDDPHRFKSVRQISNYVGFTPRRFQSGNMDRTGRISKRGNPLLRRLLVQASWAALRYDWARDIFKRVCRGSKKRRKKAIVAVARHMLVRCWAMLRDNKPWQYRTAADAAKP